MTHSISHPAKAEHLDHIMIPPTSSTPTTTAAKLSSSLVQSIKRKNPRLGIVHIVRLIDLQEQYAAELTVKNSTLSKCEIALAKPSWDTTILSSFVWEYSYAPEDLWSALALGRQNIHRVRNIIGQGVI